MTFPENMNTQFVLETVTLHHKKWGPGSAQTVIKDGNFDLMQVYSQTGVKRERHFHEL